jgi:hypothetical protein
MGAVDVGVYGGGGGMWCMGGMEICSHYYHGNSLFKQLRKPRQSYYTQPVTFKDSNGALA